MRILSLAAFVPFVILAVAAPACDCGGGPLSDEDCDNGKDDNGDGKTDCDDTTCASSPACPAGEGEGAEGEGAEGEGAEGEGGGGEQICDDDEDNDDDGDFDCEDSDCFDDPFCAPAVEDCFDLFSDDDDDDIDCRDSDCADVCTPGAGVTGSTCTAPSDCTAVGGDPLCWSADELGVSASYCSEWCDLGVANTDCGAGAICVDVGTFNGTGSCFTSCAIDDDCPTDQNCDDLGNGQKICLPPPECGDFNIGFGEGCDDGDTAAGDGCSATCTLEQCDAPLLIELGQNTGNLDNGFSLTSGSCTGFENEQVWSFTATEDGDLKLTTNADVGMYARTACNNFASETTCSFSGGLQNIPVANGDTVFVFVDTDNFTTSYTFTASFAPGVCGNGVFDGGEACDGLQFGNDTCASLDGPGQFGALHCAADCSAVDDSGCAVAVDEVEPNDTLPEANDGAAPVHAHLDTGDVDCVSVQADAGDVVSAQIEELFAGDCNNFTVDVALDIFGPSGARVASDGNGSCPSLSVAADDAGTYTVCADFAFPFFDFPFDYVIVVDVRTPVCGDGIVDATEGCEDGNAADADGCSALCQIEACLTPNPLALGVNQGDTTTALSAFTPSCAQGPAGENVWSFTAVDDGRLHAALTSTANLSLSLEKECGHTSTDAACSNNFGGNATEQGDIDLRSGDTAFVVVDGGAASAAGAYFLIATFGVAECGNGVVDIGEACDDGNVEPSDGCSDVCALDECTEALQAVVGDNSGTTVGKPNFIRGSCTGNGGEEVWSYTPTSSGTATISTDGGSFGSIGLYVEGACGDGATELGCVDGFSSTNTSVTVDAGVPVFIVVDTDFNGDEDTYTLTIDQ